MQLTRRCPARAAIARPAADAAGERHLRHLRMIDERLAGLAKAGDDVDDARRDARRFGQTRQLDRRSRGDLRRLQHDGVAGGERRRQRHDRDEGRRVPRRDDADHAERLAERVVEDRLPIERDDGAFNLVREAAEVIEPVLRDAGLRPHLGEQLAVLPGLDRGDAIRVLGDLLAPFHQQPPAPGRRQRAPRARRTRPPPPSRRGPLRRDRRARRSPTRRRSSD